MRRAFAFVLMNEDGAILLRRRPPQGLLASMMEVPGSPWLEQDMPTFAKAKTHAPAPTPWHVIPGFVTHVFTHFTLEVSVAIGRGTSTKHEAGDLWLSPRAIDDEALPSIMKKIIRYAVKSV